MFNMNKWSNNDINNAIKLNKLGYRFSEIGVILNRTTKAVKTKLNKLGFTENLVNYYEIIKCKNCNNKFKTLKSNKGIFCSQKCSAIFNNKKRKKYNNLCLYCGNKCHNKIYCNIKCKQKYNERKIFNEIENNKFSRKYNSTESRWYKKYLIYKYGEKCMKCGWKERNLTSGNIPIELEHKDGNSNNNNLNNLELLCPNCHSLTPTYKGLNIGNGRYYRKIRYHNNKKLLNLKKIGVRD